MGGDLRATYQEAIRFKTISRKDPEFVQLLDGSFSDQFRALPIRSLNVDTSSEEITFELIPIRDIERPSSSQILLQLVRAPSLILSVGPMLAVFFFCLAQGLSVQFEFVLSSFLGVLLFHIAVNLFNDYYDHMKGEDRLRGKGGSRVLQKGWLRAVTVKRAAWVLLALAGLCGLPAMIWHFSPVALLAGLVALFALEFAFQKLRLKYHGWAEIVAFALTGPLLTAGFTWAITGQVPLAAWVVGCVFGSMTLLYYHAKNFENIMPDSQAGIRTWATRAGFDASKGFSYFVVALILMSSLSFGFLFASDLKLLPTLIAQVLFLIPLVLRIKSLASPLSSELSGLRLEALKLNWITVIALVGGYLWIMATTRMAA